ncbi:hypothetical protein JOL79_28325 [Microbispora sp. RL4-1S]|uniref:Uncharacterized protein n=1 Tax=Microbispora oryzae TaxID=2806554 RepID=A0A941AKQ1_9ACTN|nr:hypothetical protein [Microbispora oryzae]MBP2707695.1 hypothetical protein [Microbispora oryzae]
MRAGVFALVCGGLSQAGHDVMAPRPVPAWSVGVALGLVTLIGYRLAGRERSARWLLAAVETVQLYLHVWFTWTTPAGGAPGVAVHGAMTGHATPMDVASAAQTGLPAHDGMPVPAMFAAHAVAGALVALWLSVGERALWRALRSLAFAVSTHLGRVLALVAPLTIHVIPATAPASHDEDDLSVTAVLRHTVVRRGPPRGRRVSLHLV